MEFKLIEDLNFTMPMRIPEISDEMLKELEHVRAVAKFNEFGESDVHGGFLWYVRNGLPRDFAFTRNPERIGPAMDLNPVPFAKLDTYHGRDATLAEVLAQMPKEYGGRVAAVETVFPGHAKHISEELVSPRPAITYFYEKFAG